MLSNISCFELPNLTPALEAEIVSVEESNDFPHEGNNLEKLAFHRSRPECSSCHSIIDPKAEGLESIGPFGNYRTHYPNGDKINIKAQLAGKVYTNTNEYMEIMSKTIDFNVCFSNKLKSKIRAVKDNSVNSCFSPQRFNRARAPV